ncbi:MAG TPA: hypothetical protein PKD26_07495 [Pyrinomonadaceae bacterium]|nr:hypothetical protein [Pyrinomonadaceae bacterium]
MGSAKHEETFVDFDQPYEQNLIGLKGIIYFGIGLFLLIVITFGLMWALLGVFEADAAENKRSTNPMQLSEIDRLPPEPRLQLAPGFRVESERGPINLELRAPQSEYWELEKQWETLWNEGRKDKGTGTITALPIEKAKELVLQRDLKARTGPEAEKAAAGASTIITDASSGRKAALKRR